MSNASPSELGQSSSDWLNRNYDPYRVAKAKAAIEANLTGAFEGWQSGREYSTAGHVLMYAAEYRRLFDTDFLSRDQLHLLQPEVAVEIQERLEKNEISHAVPLMAHYFSIFGEKSWDPEGEARVVTELERRQQEEIRKAHRGGRVFIKRWNMYVYGDQEEILRVARDLTLITGVRPDSSTITVALEGYKKVATEQMNREPDGIDPPYSYGQSDGHALWKADIVRLMSASHIDFLPGEGIKIQD